MMKAFEEDIEHPGSLNCRGAKFNGASAYDYLRRTGFYPDLVFFCLSGTVLWGHLWDGLHKAHGCRRLRLPLHHPHIHSHEQKKKKQKETDYDGDV